jgi:hypothetical protein
MSSKTIHFLDMFLHFSQFYPIFHVSRRSNQARPAGLQDGTTAPCPRRGTARWSPLVTVGRIPGSPGSALTSIGEVGELEEESGFSVRGIQYEKQKSTENPRGSQEFFHIFHEI